MFGEEVFCIYKIYDIALQIAERVALFDESYVNELVS